MKTILKLVCIVLAVFVVVTAAKTAIATKIKLIKK
jgi:hypothetical protein